MSAKATIIYDGECRFCISQMQRIRLWDTRQAFEYLPAQDPSVPKRFPFLKDMNLESGMRLVNPDRKTYVGADAVYQIARRLPNTSWFAWVYNLPVCKQIAQKLYVWVAANRKRLGQTCEAGVCKIEAHGDH